MKKLSDYKRDVETALRAANRYSPALDAQVTSLASALRTLDLANNDIDSLDKTFVETTDKFGKPKIDPHPVFKIQRDTQDSVTRQMKALGLTSEQLAGADDNDPLIELTKQVQSVGRRGKKQSK